MFVSGCLTGIATIFETQPFAVPVLHYSRHIYALRLVYLFELLDEEVAPEETTSQGYDLAKLEKATESMRSSNSRHLCLLTLHLIDYCNDIS